MFKTSEKRSKKRGAHSLGGKGVGGGGVNSNEGTDTVVIIIINNLFSIIMHNTISINIYIILRLFNETGH
jgi:hypothetical protein